MLGNVPIIEICYPQVEEDIKKKGEVKDDKIKAVHLFSDHVLYRTIDAEDPERFYQQVQG